MLREEVPMRPVLPHVNWRDFETLLLSDVPIRDVIAEVARATGRTLGYGAVYAARVRARSSVNAPENGR